MHTLGCPIQYQQGAPVLGEGRAHDDWRWRPSALWIDGFARVNDETTVLEGCTLGLTDVVSVRIFLTHFEDDYVPMNAVYAEYFPVGRRPARTCVGVTGLARGARIEIDMIARRTAAG